MSPSGNKKAQKAAVLGSMEVDCTILPERKQHQENVRPGSVRYSSRNNFRSRRDRPLVFGFVPKAFAPARIDLRAKKPGLEMSDVSS